MFVDVSLSLSFPKDGKAKGAEPAYQKISGEKKVLHKEEAKVKGLPFCSQSGFTQVREVSYVIIKDWLCAVCENILVV